MSMSMSMSMLQEGIALAFNEIELTGCIEHDPAQHALEMLFPGCDSEMLTVDLLASGYVAFPGEVFVRDYSEHSGIPGALIAAGVCELLEELSVGPFGSREVRMRVMVCLRSYACAAKSSASQSSNAGFHARWSISSTDGTRP